jgi:hypothetical protein
LSIIFQSIRAYIEKYPIISSLNSNKIKKATAIKQWFFLLPVKLAGLIVQRVNAVGRAGLFDAFSEQDGID